MSNYMKDMIEQSELDQSNIKEPENLKMYILVKDNIPLGLAMAAVGHAAVACVNQYIFEYEMDAWMKHSFKKVVCKVTEEEFHNAKDYDRHEVVTESNFDGEETAIAFCPREIWPGFFMGLKLYK
jgi:peptidyl-tRNA hydrolase